MSQLLKHYSKLKSPSYETLGMCFWTIRQTVLAERNRFTEHFKLIQSIWTSFALLVLCQFLNIKEDHRKDKINALGVNCLFQSLLLRVRPLWALEHATDGSCVLQPQTYLGCNLFFLANCFTTKHIPDPCQLFSKWERALWNVKMTSNRMQLLSEFDSYTRWYKVFHSIVHQCSPLINECSGQNYFIYCLFFCFYKCFVLYLIIKSHKQEYNWDQIKISMNPVFWKAHVGQLLQTASKFQDQ